MASDAARWRELYEREYPRLVRALLALGGSADAAEDAAQEAFIKAFRHGLARIERPSAWLLTVGSRQLFRDRRRIRREETMPDTEPPGQGTPFETAIADRAELLPALRKLPERQRAVVVARFYYDLSYAEIARAFDIKSGTVGATLSQALANLRQWQLASKLAREASQ
ncbi:MAG TPA: sigma-70 family RNA polymerase sigma factor [Candidatus Dormibacteraeota bacterium]|jgi:RNA polymerase sigma factor (sigma-70 family)|nr:sigma-70 family RNA polymerase sigma factor [Candidatus Dormibacteraeota bacterium]